MPTTFEDIKAEMIAEGTPWFREFEGDYASRPQIINEAIAKVNTAFSLLEKEEVYIMLEGGYLQKKNDSHINALRWDQFYPYATITFPLMKISPFRENFRALREDAMRYQEYFLRSDHQFQGRDWWFKRKDPFGSMACNYEPELSLQAHRVYFRLFVRTADSHSSEWEIIDDFSLLSEAQAAMEARNEMISHIIVEQIDWVVPRLPAKGRRSFVDGKFH